MSIWADIEDRSSGEIIREEDRLMITDYTNLPEDELIAIKILLAALYYEYAFYHDLSCEILSIEKGVGQQVVLSEKRKTYLELFDERGFLPEKEDDWDKYPVTVLEASRVLGEYKEGKIILYINNIKDCTSEENTPEINRRSYLTVTRYVYLHELMHAFFDRNNWDDEVKSGNDSYEYDDEIEEGLAEFGALLLLDQLVNTTPKEESIPEVNHASEWELEWAIRHVEKKKGALDCSIPEVNHASEEELEWAIRHVEKKKGALECYARGAYLFKLFGQDKDLSKRMLAVYPKKVK